MNISFGGLVLPPVTTGHPAALPPERPQVPATTKVAQVGADASASSTATHDQGEPATSPPSVMQRRIMEFLQAQAEELEAREADQQHRDGAEKETEE